jgi:hypothetical protein
VSWVVWKASPQHRLSIVLLDKTVSDTTRMEHRSLFWILRHKKIVRPDGSPYELARDYFGFHPHLPGVRGSYHFRDWDGLDPKALDSIANHADLIYYTDAYGVYTADWEKGTGGLDRSQRIYGGMTAKEAEVLKRARDLGKLVICEFNTIADPTPTAVRRRFEQDFDLSWTGWTLRSFDNLDSTVNRELPPWLIRLQLEQHHQWPFKGPGIAFVHQDGRLFILETGIHLIDQTPWIITSPKFGKELGVPDSLPYPYWIDLIATGKSIEVVSSYQLHPTDSGKAVLRRYAVPETFPAVVRSRPPARFWYFAGDHADNNVPLKYTDYAGIGMLSSFFHEGRPEDRRGFFWEYHRPLMERILQAEINRHPDR